MFPGCSYGNLVFRNVAFQPALAINKTVFRGLFCLSWALSQKWLKYCSEAWLSHDWDPPVNGPDFGPTIIIFHYVHHQDGINVWYCFCGPEGRRSWRANGGKSGLEKCLVCCVFEKKLGATEPQCMVAPHPNPIEKALIPSGRLIVALSAHIHAHTRITFLRCVHIYSVFLWLYGFGRPHSAVSKIDCRVRSSTTYVLYLLITAFLMNN